MHDLYPLESLSVGLQHRQKERSLEVATKRTILRTRPFQPFFLAAKDLLNLAYPYFQQIERSREHYNRTKEIIPIQGNIWQLEKSLSVGSFLAKYAGLEAFANCIYDEFGQRKIEDIPGYYFDVFPTDLHKKLIKKDFKKWYLGTRVYFVITFCTDSVIPPKTVFDNLCLEWKKFEETIAIRHSFNHPRKEEIKMEITYAGYKQWLVNDENPNNFWPLTKVHKDHRALNYQAATDLNTVLDWVINKLRNAMPNKLNDNFMTQENMQLLD